MFVFVSALMTFAALGAVGIGTISKVKMAIQAERDSQRQFYILTLPRSMDFESVLAFIRGLGGLSVGKLKRIVSLPTIVFEVEADHRGIRHRIGVPGHLADFVVAQIQSQLPSATIEREPREPQHWDSALELRMTSYKRSLSISSPPAVVSTFLSAFTDLKESETVLMQWVIAPALYESTEDKDYQKKQEDHTFNAIGRLASRAATQKEADHLTSKLFMSLNSVRARGVSFKSRHLPGAKKRINAALSPVGYPCLFNATELATMIAFPVGVQNVAGLPQSRAKRIAPDSRIPSEGIVLANSNSSGRERRLAVTPHGLTHHAWFVGKTGQGKSTGIHNMMAQLMEQGYGVILIEPKGDLADDVLASVPPSRVNDVIWFDPRDTERPIGLNLLAGSDPDRIAGYIVGLMKQLYGDSWGPRLEQILRYSVLTAAQQGLTLYDVKQFLINPDYRNHVVRKVKDHDLKQFWRRFDDGPDNAVDSVVNKLDSLVGLKAIRNIVGQTSGLDLGEVVEQGKILLVPLPGADLGENNASMIGSAIVAQLWQQIRVRKSREPVFLFLDEFQNFTRLPIAIEDAFAQARSYGMGIVAANQLMSQLPTSVLAGVRTNTLTKMVFAVSPEDARKLQDDLAPLEAHDIANLKQFEVGLKLMTSEGSPSVATGTTLRPPRPTGAAWDARQASRQTHGRPIAEVENEIRQRVEVSVERKNRPSIGREEPV